MLSVDNALLLSVSLVLRYGVSLWPYSGQGNPPMFGDYEAQRHWQEITTNLPIKDWYNQTENNDLNYWGLDYPPLTAYHSYLVGKVGEKMNSSFTSLNSSRGIESEQHKLFMRMSVILADIIVYFPGILLLSGYSPSYAATLLAVYPGLILIDHGHFQYNSISLGLFILAVISVTRSYDMLGSSLFCLALNYKQMELYHSLPFFFYLLAKALNRPTFPSKVSKLLQIGFAVILTFGAVWAPFLSLGPESSLQTLKRIFPFNRGLFEDKVANFWCAADMVFKLRTKLDITELTRLCFGATLILSLPSNIHLLLRPSVRNFLLAQLNTSLVFFLFSFHVHEKSILLATIPGIITLTATSSTPLHYKTVLPWFLSISTFSMLPLLYKDGLLIPFVGLSVLFQVILSNLDWLVAKPIVKGRPVSPLPVKPVSLGLTSLVHLAHFISLTGAAILTALFLLYPPPDRWPFLWPAVIALYCAGHFLLFCLYFHYVQFAEGGQDLVLQKKKN